MASGLRDRFALSRRCDVESPDNRGCYSCTFGAKGAIELYGFKGEGNYEYVQIWVPGEVKNRGQDLVVIEEFLTRSSRN